MSRDSVATAVQIVGEAAGNAAPFSSGAFNLSSRSMTTAAVSWDPVPVWSSASTQQTPDLTPILQEIVNGSGWASGQAIVLVLSGTERAYSRSRMMAISAGAPILHVEYTLAPGSTIVANLTVASGADDVEEFVSNGLDDFG